MNRNDYLQKMAQFGAATRLQSIKNELDLMYQFLPELFPDGPVPLPGGNDSPVTSVRHQHTLDKQRQAQKLIEGAEKMHAKAQKAKRVYKPRKSQAKPQPAQDPRFVTVKQAAQLLRYSDANVRIYITQGHLKVVDTDGPQATMRLRRSDVVAFGVERGRITQQAAEAHEQIMQGEAVHQ